MQDLKLNKDFKVTLHNDLVQARYRKQFSLIEQKILFAVLSNVEPNPTKEIEPFRINIKEFTKWLGLADPNYAAFEKVVENLMEKDLITIKQPDGSWDKFRWIARARYIKKTGLAEIYLAPEIYPYLLNLDNNFTTIRLNMLLGFKSSYSMRLYQLIKKWSGLKKWKVDIDELKMLLGVPYTEKNGVKKFKLEPYGNFKNKALKIALAEINELSEFKVQLEEIKHIRKVTSLQFYISTKENKESKNSPLLHTPVEVNNFGYELLKKYDYREKCLFDKKTNKKVYVDDRERVQLILLNRCNILNVQDEILRLLEKELEKVVNLTDFDISYELDFIFRYVKNASGINRPAEFILSQTKKLVERLLNGEKIGYKDVFKVSNYNIQKEQIPHWWYEGERSGRLLKDKEPETKITSDSTLDITTVKFIRTMLRLGHSLEDLAKQYDMEEYNRLESTYGIENLLEEKAALTV